MNNASRVLLPLLMAVAAAPYALLIYGAFLPPGVSKAILFSSPVVGVIVIASLLSILAILWYFWGEPT